MSANIEEDDLREEYDFSQMKGGVRSNHCEQYRKGTNAVFSVQNIFNDALR